MNKRIIIIGPTTALTTAIERTLKSRGDAVVVADDARHALLLLRIFGPETIIAPSLDRTDLALVLASSSRPLLVVATVDELTAMDLLRQGVARVVPESASPATLGAVVDAPLSGERAVPRALAQLGLLRSTGTLAIGDPLVGEIAVDAGRVRSASATVGDVTRALYTLLSLDGPQQVSFIPADTLVLDIEEGPSLDAIAVDEEDIETAVPFPRAPVTSENLAALPPPTVLVVEDDPDLARLYATVLRTRGFVVDVAVDGVDGYQQICAAPHDVVVSDIMMPRETGWDLLARVRNTARLREQRFILLSHHGEMITRLRGANSGADAYLQKATRPDGVVTAVVAAITPRRDLAAVLYAGANRLEGDIATIGAQSLLRMLAAHQMTGRLAIRAGFARYLVTLEGGDVVDAQCSMGHATLHHRDALRSLLLLDDGVFTFVAGTAPRTAPPTPLVSLLDELCAELEHWLDSSRSDALADGSPLQTQPELLTLYLGHCPDAARDVVTHIARGTTPRAIISGGIADPVLVDSVVRDLFRKGVVSLAATSSMTAA
jgi:DNA-binding response OmpR family regulator